MRKAIILTAVLAALAGVCGAQVNGNGTVAVNGVPQAFSLWGIAVPNPSGANTVLTYNSGALTWGTVSGASPGGTGSEFQYRSGASTFGAVTGSSFSGTTLSLGLGNALALNYVAAPTTSPTVAVGAAGNLTGNYWWAVTFVTATGETELGAVAGTPLGCGAYYTPLASQQANLTAIPTGPTGTLSRNIYRWYNGIGDLGGCTTARFKLVANLAGNSATTYTDNTADGDLGVFSPTVNTTGGTFYLNAGILAKADARTTIFGTGAGFVNGGYGNQFVGVSTGALNTTGYFNTFHGFWAGKNSTTNYFTTATGAIAFSACTDGCSYTNAYGARSLASLTSGVRNNAFGVDSMHDLQNGSSNTVQGHDGFYTNIDGSWNAGVGSDIFVGILHLNQSSGVGSEINAGSDGGSLTGVTAAGYRSFYVGKTGADYDTCYGWESCYTTTTGTNITLIGSGVNAPTPTTSNVAVIGNASVTDFYAGMGGVSNVHGAVYYSGAGAGMTTVVTVRNAGGSADCTMTYTGGILTATTCSHT